jgi:hypothetical protein
MADTERPITAETLYASISRIHAYTSLIYKQKDQPRFAVQYCAEVRAELNRVEAYFRPSKPEVIVEQAEPINIEGMGM